MAEGGVPADGAGHLSLEQLTAARRLQELFHGRFTEDESCQLLEANNWDCGRAAAFCLRATSEQLRDIIGAGEWKVVQARRNRTVVDKAQRNQIESDIHQYACQQCDFMWWRRVPTRKKVSKCKCGRKYNALARDREWGWAEFHCQCGHMFKGFGAMEMTESPCYHCHSPCRPVKVFPPFRKRDENAGGGGRGGRGRGGAGRGRRRRPGNLPNVHSCTAPNCYNRTLPSPGAPMVNMCVHPKSLTHKVINASDAHASTGSTVATFFIKDDDLETFCQFDSSSRLSDIDEEDDEHGGDDGDNQ